MGVPAGPSMEQRVDAKTQREQIEISGFFF